MAIQEIGYSTTQSRSVLEQRSPKYKSSMETRLIKDTVGSHTSKEKQVQGYLVTAEGRGVIERYMLIIIYIGRRRGRKKYCGDNSPSKMYEM